MLALTVDLAVHKGLAKADSLKRFQRAKGKHLAFRLREVLAPLCVPDPHTGEQSDTDSEVDDDTTDLLSGVFISAIDMMCRLVCTGFRYESAWHKPGAAFDPKTMYPTEKQKVGATEMEPVRLALLPGINQVTAPKIKVDFGGFGEQRYKEHEEAVCLVPALVLQEIVDSGSNTARHGKTHKQNT